MHLLISLIAGINKENYGFPKNVAKIKQQNNTGFAPDTNHKSIGMNQSYMAWQLFEGRNYKSCSF